MQNIAVLQILTERKKRPIIKNMHRDARCILSIFFLIFCLSSSFSDDLQTESLKPNPWSLIIFRPSNPGDMNIVRCWLKLEDAESGEDVTYTKAKAKYEFVADNRSRPLFDSSSFTRMFRDVSRKLTDYRKTYYLSGGMAMHLNLKPGKYKITVYTPRSDSLYVKTENKGDWLSNEFYYDTENPTNVIFVTPTLNDNGFYAGEWRIDHKLR